ncbi:FxsA family protein [Rossellomorea marisflavi]|uniref:FxsA family protein n=1 Tax=Rossellomorea marisflavi TaxID=189381 RepID=UPI00064FDD24|nr:FxsA family protein [Rossellomorea marisflavi]KMK94056.1 exlusion protein FxsA [Rossellomorea marisflavi]KML07404.1 exlusion protein FxsA [Rossellomorea marisflavi]KML34439.1 exlusion protein FxsA [Rossellomorea marisflavi]MCM2604822.1 membrane protein FxsA [Rossellomorea marisflavi]TYO73409.1 membrane protein FxsA [Rossellomorea marisflavi]
MKYILASLIIFPFVEISLLIWSGHLIGAFPTIFLMILTGLLGAFLAKKQGLDAIRKVQQDIQSGRMPGGHVTDGLCIAAGGFLLILPGFVSDLLGLILLLPPTRSMIKPFLFRLFRRWGRNRNVIIYR